jgi:deoxyribodipyrimidine photolyase-like uncharacterized protein
MWIKHLDIISSSEELDNKKPGKAWEIVDLFTQIPTFNISDLEDKCQWVHLDSLRKELTDILQQIDNELSIENFFIEKQQDIDLIINLSKRSGRWTFEFRNREELIKYLEVWRQECSLPKVENTKKIPLKVFIETYEGALWKAEEYLMVQDRFG